MSVRHLMFRKNNGLTDDVPGKVLRGRGRFGTNDYFHGGFSVRRRYGRGKRRVRDCISIIDSSRESGLRAYIKVSLTLCCVTVADQASSGSGETVALLPVAAVPVVCRVIVVSAICRLYRRKESFWITGIQTPVACGGPGVLVMPCMMPHVFPTLVQGYRLGLY
jgi:hypothetical protein